jgi:hypothetical protein
MSQAYLRSLRSTTSTEDNRPANPSTTSTEDNSPASPFAQANFTKFRVKVSRNVHFLDARNNEVAGFWQNGSVVWEEIQEWMQIVIENATSSYTPFRCLEAGGPEDPAGQHGPPIYMANNRSTIDAGYYVFLAYDGECESSNHHIHFMDILMISSHRFQPRDHRHS